ncbi:dipeptidase [Limosilactobacillus reuteri]|uniref:Sapep family Mn(2+)-dependent dipeptidase n=2 Tax=Limosilactobacillus reuteri TaxID=1598 RepID=A0AAW9ZIY4_LIMRT|nr:dipeptidase [Limosilactobacillus reuteri]CCC03441.1 putative Xaa-His dipeptidase [Limosilactobacillus reuteri subsp. suis]MCC4366633.1 dipeptidase [Limosilactobacillus reuteri]MCC4388883.1 dipeptidase [Limosilactobacillus reuteri]MCC4390793.1 dipeptidase [Limosilactobacillus reuteri]MCC4416987.1 dipeptidase [Limosilactobacillus reuteri]
MDKIITEDEQKAAVKTLERLISVPSYNQPAEEGAPFGKGIRNALDEMMKICDELSFKTYEDPDGYYGYAEVGSGDKIFGVICHLDTVPAGDLGKWKHNPFKGTVINDAVYGRGSQDDKGPGIAALYAVKALMDQGYHFNQRIRFIYGTDEEILWRGIAEYNKKEAPIDSGISPDAEFPLIYAEKGLQQSYLVGPGTDQLKLNLKNAFNAVPDSAVYDGPKQDEVKVALDKHGFEYTSDDNSITVIGKSVHAMMAPKGTNAVLRLAIALDDVFDFKPLDFIGKLFKEGATGSNVLGDVRDESGQLTFNISSLEINENETRMQIDLRIPVTVDRDNLLAKLSKQVAAYDLKYVHFDYLAPLYVPKDSKLVRTLMKVYKEQTGDVDAEPQISGGATFARTMNNCVAFGGMLPTTPDYMHQANEQWPLSDMYKAMEIYAQAIKKLCVD